MSEVIEKLRKKARAAIYTESCVTVLGGRSVLIENVTNVYECNEIMARVRTRDGDVTVWGVGLEMSGFKESVVRISGKISSVELSERSGVKNA